MSEARIGVYLSGCISVLIPTRGRERQLRESIGSLEGLAAEPGQVEILVAVDPDDTPPDIPGAVVHVTWERYGYRLLHQYYNELAELASGDWLFIWNDDAFMRTAGWDTVIRTAPPNTLLWPYVSEAQGMNVFPVVPRAWFKAIGHLSLNHSIDMWLIDVGSKLQGRVRHVPVTVSHVKTMDETARQRDITADVMTFHEPDMQAARGTEAATLLDIFGPGNRHLISVVFPAMDGIGEHIMDLLVYAEWPQEIEFLVAGWNRDGDIRSQLENAGLMGMSEVHPSSDMGYVRSQAHDAHVVDFGTFVPAYGWDAHIRRGQ